MEKIPENIMTVMRAVMPLLIVIILFILVGQFGFGKIADMRAQIADATEQKAVLTQKLDILRSIKDTGTSSSNLTVSALPDSNPSLLVSSQVKVLAGTNSLGLSKMQSASAVADTGSGLSTVTISFEVTGPRSQIESFIDGIKTIAPISVVDTLKLTESTPGVSVVSVGLKAFWAPFPTKVPAVMEAITDLSPAEKKTLEAISSLTQPIFVQVQPVQGGKANPFSP